MLLKFLIIIHKIKLFYLIEYDANYDKILKESKVLDRYLAPLFTRQFPKDKDMYFNNCCPVGAPGLDENN